MIAARHREHAVAAGISVEQALRNFGLEPQRIAETCALPPRTFAALEVHDERGALSEFDNSATRK